MPCVRMKIQIAVAERGSIVMVTKVKKCKFQKRAIAWAMVAAMLCACVPLGIFAANEDTVQKPEASVTPGMYREEQTVALTAGDGAEIYYTTNNLMPTEQDARYTEPISVASDTNICAIAVKDGVKSAPVTFGYFIRTSETPQMQFVVMSDMEVGEGLYDESNPDKVYALNKSRVFHAMRVMKRICSNPALLVVNGDIVTNNRSKNAQQYPSKEGDHEAFINLMKNSMANAGISDTQVQVTIGNHDSVDHVVANMKQQYVQNNAEDWFPADTGYYHKEVNGFDFIYLNGNDTSDAQATWLKNEMEVIAAAQTDGVVKPVFLFTHIPLKSTLDYDEYTTNSTKLTNILKSYPQAIIFSGHSHVPLSRDDAINQDAGFTAINEGSVKYSWVPKSSTYTYRADGSVQETNEFPITQAAVVEVYADRVEVNRVTVNADWGDAKANDYLPVEPYNNGGVVAGQPWVIRRGATTDEWTANFEYKKSQRTARAQAPQFAEGAKPAISGEERTATVTFPQAEDAQKVDKYLIELVNANTGKTEKSMKVWSENVFSPIPEKLTYAFDGLAAGTSYRAKVTAYNDYGTASEPVVSEEIFTTAELPGKKPDMIAEEDFSNPLTDADLPNTVIPYVENYSSGGVMGTGTMEISSGENGAAKWVSNNKGGTNLLIPFGPGATVATKEDGTKKYTPKCIQGEFFFEFDVQRLSALSGKNVSFYLRNGSVNAAKLTISASNINYEYYYKNSSGKAMLSGYTSGSVSNGAHKIRLLLGTDGETQYLGGLWIDGKTITTKKQPIADYPSAAGWKVMAAEPSAWATGDMCSVDNIKVWRPTTTQLQEIVIAGEDDITFDQIKGGNAAADAVTENLELDKLVGMQTANGLQILGWQSSNSAVIAPDGTVTRPAFAGNTAVVQLMPILGMVDTMNETGEEYVRTSGTPISVTVPDLGLEPLEVAQTGYIANEDFSQALTDADHARTIVPYIDNYSSGGVMGTGTIEITSGEDGAAKWVSNNKGGTNLMIPFRPGTVISDNAKNPQPINGEFTISFDIKRLAAVSGQALEFLLRNGAGTNVGKLTVDSASIKLEYYSGGQWLSYASAAVSGDTHTIRMLLGTDGSTQYLGGLWIDTNEVAAKKQLINGYPSDTGWKVIATQPKASWVIGDMCSVDNIKVWRSAADQAKELAAADAGKITFAQIKGQNDTPEAVTEDLRLVSGEAGALQTENKLLVMGWKSDTPAVISNSGKVTRPETDDVTVALTPVLAIQSSETGAYTTVDGAPITVIVKAQPQPRQSGFFDADGNLMTTLDVSIVQGKMDISEMSGEVVIYAALYSNEQLEQVWRGATVAAGTADAAAAVALTLPSDLTGKILKLFVWDADTMKNMCIPIIVQ